jgi:hypothetical protein
MPCSRTGLDQHLLIVLGELVELLLLDQRTADENAEVVFRHVLEARVPLQGHGSQGGDGHGIDHSCLKAAVDLGKAHPHGVGTDRVDELRKDRVILPCPRTARLQVLGSGELIRREETVLAGLAHRQREEASIRKELCEAVGELRAGFHGLLVFRDQAGRGQHQYGSCHDPESRGGDARRVHLTNAYLADEVTLVALAAARVEAQLDPVLGELFEASIPRLHHLHEGRACRNDRSETNHGGPARACVRHRYRTGQEERAHD